jgi:hypothetical protein
VRRQIFRALTGLGPERLHTVQSEANQSQRANGARMTNQQALDEITEGVRSAVNADAALRDTTINGGGATGEPITFARGKAVVRLFIYVKQVCIAIGESGTATPLKIEGDPDEQEVAKAIATITEALRQPILPRPY